MRLEAGVSTGERSPTVNIRRSEVVVRGGVEPPTFRFSGLRTTVHDRPWRSFYLYGAGPVACDRRPCTYVDETQTETLRDGFAKAPTVPAIAGGLPGPRPCSLAVRTRQAPDNPSEPG
jgi:hypothetical protein